MNEQDPLPRPAGLRTGPGRPLMSGYERVLLLLRKRKKVYLVSHETLERLVHEMAEAAREVRRHEHAAAADELERRQHHPIGEGDSARHAYARGREQGHREGYAQGLAAGRIPGPAEAEED